MDYGIITFRSHPCDKSLDDEFYQLVTPILNKADKYVVAQESPLTPDAHYHIFLSFVGGDTLKLKQKFATKPMINWITKTETTMTKIDNPGKKKLKDCFNRDGTNPGLHVEKIPKKEEDHIKTLGYVCKENVVKTRGFNDKQITEAVKYYHTSERKKPEVKSDWKILNIKTVIPYIEQVAKEEGIPPYDKLVPLHMARRKMYLDISDKQQQKVTNTLRIAHSDDMSDTLQEAMAEKLYHSDSDLQHLEMNQYQKERLMKIIAQYQELLEEKGIEDTTEWKSSEIGIFIK